jgi:DMSO/TMAO reductase YedYZ molybdopterin-dependent catalytic subunit
MSPRSPLRTAVRRLTPPPRVVDLGILLLVAAELASGVTSLGVGHPSGRWVFWLHGVAGTLLVWLVALKLWRVRRRIRSPPDRAARVSILTAVVAVGALATGVGWVLGADVDLVYWNLLNLHIFLGLLLVPLVLLHLRSRFRLPSRREVTDRRTALRFGALLVAAALTWRVQGLLVAALETAGASRRFTGSRPVSGRSFPVTSWVADDPDPVDMATWRLAVDGLVERPLSLPADALGPDTGQRALLDCTSGWYTVQDWQGVRVGTLLDRAGVEPDGAWVRFLSVTGYRWSLPLPEARDALLATHVAGRPLSHGHGAPLRLVAPGRRGFQWVKWIVRVEVRARPDPGQYVATLISGFTPDDRQPSATDGDDRQPSATDGDDRQPPATDGDDRQPSATDGDDRPDADEPP